MIESSLEFRVRYAETDQMGVVYHANYLVWCEMGRTDLLRQLGATYAELERQGVFLAVSDARMRLRGSVRYDDLVRVGTRLSRLRTRSVSFSYVVEHADGRGVLAEVETELICLDSGRSPRKLPAALRERLRRALAPVPTEGTTDVLSGV
jgi:acyl-CoA thioester hydrolase